MKIIWGFFFEERMWVVIIFAFYLLWKIAVKSSAFYHDPANFFVLRERARKKSSSVKTE